MPTTRPSDRLEFQARSETGEVLGEAMKRKDAQAIADAQGGLVYRWDDNSGAYLSI